MAISLGAVAAGSNPWMAAGMAGLGALGSIFGGENKPGLTEADIAAAAAQANQGYNRAYNEYNRPTNIGGTSTSMGATASERKRQAAIDFFVQQGMSVQDARAKADKIAKPGGKKFNQIKGLKNYIEDNGAQYGLKINGKGKIKGTPASFNFESPTDPLQSMGPMLSAESFASAYGLPSAFAEETRQGLDFRKEMRDILSAQLANADVEFDPTADIENIMTAQNDYLRGALSQLADTGFASSSLTGNILGRGLNDSSNSLYTNLLNRSQEFKLNKSQNIGNLLNVANSLYGPNTFGEYIGGSFVDPSEYGGFTSPQAYAASQQERSGRAGVRQNQAQTVASINTQPRYADQGGGFLGL